MSRRIPFDQDRTPLHATPASRGVFSISPIGMLDPVRVLRGVPGGRFYCLIG